MANVIYTTAGLAALLNAQQTGLAPVTIAQIGLSTQTLAGNTASLKALTELPSEFKRLASLGGELASPSLIHVTLTDPDPVAYSVRSLGLYTNTGVLLAVYSDASVIVAKAVGVTLLFAFDMPLLDSVNPGSVVIEGVGFSVPPATREVAGVIRIATPTEVRAGQGDNIVVTPAQLSAELRRQLWPVHFLNFSH